MKIKVILESKHNSWSKIVTPIELLDSFEEDFIDKIICNNCNYISVMENGEPSCYGECVEKVIEDGYSLIFEEVDNNDDSC